MPLIINIHGCDSCISVGSCEYSGVSCAEARNGRQYSRATPIRCHKANLLSCSYSCHYSVSYFKKVFRFEVRDHNCTSCDCFCRCEERHFVTGGLSKLIALSVLIDCDICTGFSSDFYGIPRGETTIICRRLPIDNNNIILLNIGHIVQSRSRWSKTRWDDGCINAKRIRPELSVSEIIPRNNLELVQVSHLKVA
jgi:hypothetical protein